LLYVQDKNFNAKNYEQNYVLKKEKVKTEGPYPDAIDLKTYKFLAIQIILTNYSLSKAL
jgi:hypothetical protein